MHSPCLSCGTPAPRSTVRPPPARRGRTPAPRGRCADVLDWRRPAVGCDRSALERVGREPRASGESRRYRPARRRLSSRMLEEAIRRGLVRAGRSREATCRARVRRRPPPTRPPRTQRPASNPKAETDGRAGAATRRAHDRHRPVGVVNDRDSHSCPISRITIVPEASRPLVSASRGHGWYFGRTLARSSDRPVRDVTRMPRRRRVARSSARVGPAPRRACVARGRHRRRRHAERRLPQLTAERWLRNEPGPHARVAHDEARSRRMYSIEA